MLRVLTYHRIAEPEQEPALSPRLISATPDEFARQMRYLARHYDPVSLPQVLDAARTRRPLPRRALLITFDDAYRDFLEVAWPILEAHGLPAGLFVPTAYPDRPERSFWWDRLHRAFMETERDEIAETPLGVLPLSTPAEKRASLARVHPYVKSLPHDEGMECVHRLCTDLASGDRRGQRDRGGSADPRASGVLGWDELRRLARAGVTLGAHTRWHPLLTRVSPERAREEIAGSQNDLAREIANVLPVFAYPGGAHDDTAARILREEGFVLGFTQLDGHNDLRSGDLLRLRRTNVTRKTTLPVLRLRLQRWFTWIDGWRHRERGGDRHGMRGRNRHGEPGRRRPGERGGHRHGEPGCAPLPHRSRAPVAYIMSRFPKLTETFILYEMLTLEELGHRVEVFPLLRERQSVTHAEAARMVQRAHYHPFVSRAILWAQLSFLFRRPGAYFKALAEVLCGTWGSANFFLGAIGIFPKSVRFAHEMEKQGITHVHAHFANHPAVAALIIHRLTGIPFSFTAHGSDLHVERRMLDRKVAAAAFAVTVSGYNRELMVQECGERMRDKIHVVHCGVDPEVFMPHRHTSTPRPPGRRTDSFQILCVGSFEEVKGHRYLIDACQRLRTRGVRFTCHLVGDGPRRGSVEAQIRRLGLQGEVRVHGARPRHEVARLLSEADVVALTSVPTRRGKREGIPVVLMEAMATGLPVVSSAISGIPELVEDGRSGFLVPPCDTSAIAEALHKLSTDADLRRRMGRSGRRRVERHFDLRRNTSLLSRLFERRPAG